LGLAGGARIDQRPGEDHAALAVAQLVEALPELREAELHGDRRFLLVDLLDRGARRRPLHGDDERGLGPWPRPGRDGARQPTRGLCMDLLERFCQPYTDVPALFPGDKGQARTKTFPVDQVLELVAVPAKELPTMKAVLAAGKVEGFTMTWRPRVDQGRGKTAT